MRGARQQRQVLDDVSKAIISQLQQDGRRSYAAIGKVVGLSEAAVRQRVQRLTESGVMQVVAVTDPMELGFARQAMVGVKVTGAIARVVITPPGRSLCDALESPFLGEITFPILQRHLAGAVSVTDAEVAEAMRYAYATLKLVVEPGGAAGLAALLAGKVAAAGRTTGLLLSGGNVDPELFYRLVA